MVEYVSAAAQAGQPLPLPAIMALGTIAGGVGGNLLASQIQNWYEAATRDEAPDEAAVLAWLAEHAVAKQDLQPVLDQILEALQAIPQAHDALASADWHPFFAQLQSDMRQIGNSARFEAQLIGDGLIIQGDDNIVAGRVGLVLQGDVGELIMDQSTQTVTHKNQYGDVVYGDKVGGDQVAGDKITVEGDLIKQTDPAQVDQQALRVPRLGLSDPQGLQLRISSGGVPIAHL